MNRLKIIVEMVENGYIISRYETDAPTVRRVAYEAASVRDIVYELTPKG